MTENRLLCRRDVLRWAGGSLALAAISAPMISRAWSQGAAAKSPIDIVMTSGVSGLVLHEMAKTAGYFDDFGLAPKVLQVSDGTKATAALIGRSSEICMWSGFNQLTPAIERGGKLKILAGALNVPSLCIYSKRNEIRTVKDLAGKSVGIGPSGGVLHQMVILLLRKAGVSPASVTFRNVGNITDIFKAVVAGTVDAGPSDVDVFDQQEKYKVHALTDGLLWEQIKEYTNQGTYASDSVIATKRDVLVRVLAAYAKVYRFVSGSDSKEAFVSARAIVTGKDERTEALSQWNWIQRAQPYATDLVLSSVRINLVQQLNVDLGVQTKVLPFEQVADMSLARDAVKLLG
jgi:ABC-type nitrate/sulfonate/bicarbonate transport system substrate-binding protein